ncbi:MAG: alpha/beta hydrolase [Desulfobulbaceae bacterium]|nr:alpha/beta hydrolase [Desulfobulbaceae bacterium]
MDTPQNTPTLFFLHGLDSSSQGFKARWFREHFPQMCIHDYTGSLASRLSQLAHHTQGIGRYILVGSSYGGLMAACHARLYPQQCAALILLAPALNFEAYQPPPEKLDLPVTLLAGEGDTVCPPDLVLPLAYQSFSQLDIKLVHDDHLLHHSFQELDWPRLLQLHI